MNGRIYNPTLDRFVQADPFIQFPKLTQSHNRYSYVLNNPLTYNDPSGYFLKKLMKVTGLTSILKAIASIPILDAAVSIVLNFIPGCQVWCAALYQGLKTYAVTSDFGAGLKADIITAMTAAVSAEIGSNLDFELGGWTAVQNVASHAMVGGVSAVLQGGKFGHGFVSSLVIASMKGFMNPKTTNFGNAYSRTAIAGVVGGTVSKLTGGKFANGAVTSVMQWWYNAEGNPSMKSKRSLAISKEEREFARLGNRKAFWESRLKAGDSLAKTALNIVNDDGFLEQITNIRLRAHLKLIHPDAFTDSPLTENEVGVALMRAHMDAVDFDFNNYIGTTPGSLSYMQVDTYHYEVFEQLQIRGIVYGGALVPGSISNWAYCNGCDITGERIR